MKMMIRELAQKTHTAYQAFLQDGTTEKKNAILKSIAEGIEANREALKHANQNDLNIGRDKRLTEAFLDRLALNDARIDGMIKSCKELIDLPDPVGEIYESSVRPEGFTVSRMRVPIGVIGIIYEARPQRDHRSSHPVHEIRQCDHPARWKQRVSFQYSSGQRHSKSPERQRR